MAQTTEEEGELPLDDSRRGKAKLEDKEEPLPQTKMESGDREGVSLGESRASNARLERKPERARRNLVRAIGGRKQDSAQFDQEAHEWAWIDKAERQEFFLPLNGFVWFYFDELKVINHPAFQRLAKINQLGQAHYVFRGATHKRIEHVMGAVDVVQRMISAVALNSQKSREFKGEADWRAPLSPREQRFVRLGALLHDIGHLASGHTLEDELCLFGKHDEDERLDEVYNRTNWGTGRKEESLADLIDREFSRYVPDSLEPTLSASQIVRLLTRKDTKEAAEAKPESRPRSSARPNSKIASETSPLADEAAQQPGQAEDEDAKRVKALRESNDIRADVCASMIGNTICADLLDYIYRDWYHVGKLTLAEDRIYQYMEIRHPDNPPARDDATSRRHYGDRFVIALGEHSGRRPRIRTDAVSAILGLLERRYELGETVLYHRTKLAAGAMLGRALFELWAGSKSKKVPQTILMLSDDQLLEYALIDAKAKLRKKKGRDVKARAAQTLLHNLQARRLYDSLYSVRHWSIAPGQRDSLTNLFAPDGDRNGQGAWRRTQAARQLERDFDLPPGSLVISCTNVRPKIAEVLIRVNGEIDKFNDYEEKHDSRGLSGGHLTAQIRRFRDLWRVDFFVDCDVLAELETPENLPKRNLIMDAIEDVFINPPADLSARERTVERIAMSYKQLKEGVVSTVDRPRVLDPSHVTARSDRGRVRAPRFETYPNDVRTISSFLAEL